MDSRTNRLTAGSAESPGTALHQPRVFWIVLGAVTAVFGAVRFGCLFNDLWLDEIWSLRLLEQIRSPMGILTQLLHDNNHPLNSLFLYWLMPAKADWTYRLLSWFTGTATVWLAGLIARRQFQLLHPGDAAGAPAAGLITATVFGSSYLLIHYSSEARGYAPAVGFGFLAIYSLWRGAGRPAGAWAVVYGLACVLGLVAHLVVFQVMLAGLAWSAVTALRDWPRWRDRLVYLAGWHLGPWTFLGAYYFAFVRKVEIGGGPRNPLIGVLGDLAAFSLGFPGSAGVLLALPVFLAVIVAVLLHLWRRDRALACFYATAIFIAPMLGMLSSRFGLLFPRYFIMSAACALLLAGDALTRLWHSRSAMRGTGAVVLAGMLLGNGAHTVRLMRDGRGQYQPALRYIADHTPSAAITLTSDSDLRNFGVMEYHARVMNLGRELQYFPGNELPPGGTQWVLYHRLDGGAEPPGELYRTDGLHYQLDRVYRHAALSGWDWYVYHNVNPAVLAPLPR